ncbi:hypothetical protein [Allomesorhizobium camelthorni]|uniref:Uncharacterized protein n=1 Tax=Allomesorhizobium camelthorni TaxID=475069 RepID=A0A6G4WPM2_9HYPH|nr:hypothetical protein [Mesorhizobium camelthorni]NGO56060.1 hypothetical protein [Mesorhizobium camelthorni]
MQEFIDSACMIKILPSLHRRPSGLQRGGKVRKSIFCGSSTTLKWRTIPAGTITARLDLAIASQFALQWGFTRLDSQTARPVCEKSAFGQRWGQKSWRSAQKNDCNKFRYAGFIIPLRQLRK